jgi:hypothetical protein
VNIIGKVALLSSQYSFSFAAHHLPGYFQSRLLAEKPSGPPEHSMWQDLPLLAALAFFNTGNQIAFIAGRPHQRDAFRC